MRERVCVREEVVSRGGGVMCGYARGSGSVVLLSIIRRKHVLDSMENSKDDMGFGGVPRFATPDTGADAHRRHYI